jgi:hypothetical protein
MATVIEVFIWLPSNSLAGCMTREYEMAHAAAGTCAYWMRDE